MIIKKLNNQKIYENRVGENIKHLEKNYRYIPNSIENNTEKYNNENSENNFNYIISKAKNNYEKITICYSNISTGYHKIYNSSFNYQKFQNDLVYKLKLGGYDEIELTDIEQRFLNGLVCFFKPKKILEIGVSKGGSSALILNAIQNINDSFLYSMDLNKMNYRFNNKLTGFIIDEKFPYLKQKWKLYTGDIPCEFIEEVGNNIDFVFIDTVHLLPGEFLNFLEVLPFLKKNAIVVFHDIEQIGKKFSSNDRLFSIIKGIKVIPIQENDFIVTNIGAIILDEDIYERLFDIFFGIYTTWQYIPSENQINKLMRHFRKYYGEKYFNFFKEIFTRNKNSRKI